MITKENYIPILNSIAAPGQKHGKNYSTPSEQTLLKNLRKYHGWRGSLRKLQRIKAMAKADGYFESNKRTKCSPDGTKTFTSTLYKLTRKAYKLMGSLVRKLTYNTRTIFTSPAQKESPRIQPNIPGPDEVRSPFADLVPALTRDLLKSMG